MKTQEELEALKKRLQEVNKVLGELTEEELLEVYDALRLTTPSFFLPH